MGIKMILTVLSVIFTLVAYVPYVKKILEDGTVKPNRASWFVWWIIDAVMTWALLSAHEYSSAVMFAAFTCGTTIVLLLSLRRGEGEFETLDWVCIAIAILGVVLWRTTEDTNPTFSVVANMLAATVGTLPTLKKAVLKPDSEDPLTWKLFWTGGLFNTLAIPRWTFMSAAGTIAVWILQWAINACLYWGRIRQKREVALVRA